MKTKSILIVCLAALMTACSQKQSAVSVPVSHINVENLLDSIDYDMDVSGLPLSDISLLRYAPAARKGFPIKDSYLRGIFQSTTWYDSLMYKFAESTHFDPVEMKPEESYRDYYYRASIATEAIKFTDQEQAFIDRMQAREAELQKENFAAGEGLRVNMQNLSNPTQIKEFDSLLCQHLAKDGFAIVPADHDQLFNIYEQNDYSQFPNFVTTDLYLQLYHLYIDCALREVEEQKLLPMIVKFTRNMHELLYNMERWSGADEKVNALAHHNAEFYNIAHKLFTGEWIFDREAGSIEAEEVRNATEAVNNTSEFMEDYHDIMFPYSLFRPRGHYTRTEKLQRYFRGMMWLQTVPFGMQNEDEVLAAVQQACALGRDKTTQKLYNTMNGIITLMMGQSDNLSLPQVMAEVEKTGLQMEDLIHNDQAIAKITASLTDIGNKQTRIRPKFEKTSHNKINVMPQRYQPDAEVLLKMVDYDGKPTRRAVPKGLDFFAAMGVSSAEQILMQEKTEWKAFGDSLKAMKKRMGEIDWSETTCTQWMHTLKVLTDKEGKEKMPYLVGRTEARRHPLRQAADGCRVWWRRRDTRARGERLCGAQHRLLEEGHRTARQHGEGAETGGHAHGESEGCHPAHARGGPVPAGHQREGVGRKGACRRGVRPVEVHRRHVREHLPRPCPRRRPVSHGLERRAGSRQEGGPRGRCLYRQCRQQS